MFRQNIIKNLYIYVIIELEGVFMKFSKKLYLPLILILFFLSLLFFAILGQDSFSLATDTEEYCVRWHDAEGEVIYSENLPKNSIPQYAQTLPLPKKEGQEGKTYFFTGWSPEIEAVEQDADYYPQYREEDHEYEVILYYGYDYDGSGVENDEGDIFKVLALGRFDVIEMPSFRHVYEVGTERFTFTDWDRPVWGWQAQDIENVYGNNFIEIHAIYVCTPATFRIGWMDGDLNYIYVEEVLKGETPVYNRPFNPSKSSTEYYNYQFIGWDKTPQPAYKDEDYYAQFEEVDRYYDIYWLDGDSSLIYQEKLLYGQPLKFDDENHKTPTLRKPDYFHYYKFVGWDNYKEGDTVTETVFIKPIFEMYDEVIEEYGVQKVYVAQDILTNSSVFVDLDVIDETKPLEILACFTLSFDTDAVSSLKNNGDVLNVIFTVQNKKQREYGLNVSQMLILEANIDDQKIDKFDGEVVGIYNNLKASRDNSIWFVEGKNINEIGCDVWIEECYRFEIKSCGKYIVGRKDYTLTITLSTILPCFVVIMFLVVFFGLRQKRKLSVRK